MSDRPSRPWPAGARALGRARRDLLLGGAVVALFLVGGCAWAAFTPLSGAVMASGNLTLKGSVKSIEPPIGGTVAEIAVTEGQEVKAGSLLLRFDDTLARANLAIVAQQIDELEARTARLKVEAGLADTMEQTTELAERRRTAPSVDQTWAGEARLLSARRDMREGQKAQLSEQIAQLREQIQGLELQTRAKEKEIELVNIELGSMEELVAKKLVSLSRATAVRREAARIEGELGQLRASTASARGRIAEIGIQILAIDQVVRSEATQEQREIEGKLAELRERRVAAIDQLSRLDVNAPTSGIVHQLAVHTIKSYVAAGDTVLKIVPRDDTFVVTAHLDPSDIDQVHVGQDARLRFSAFQQETTPEILGSVSRVSADVTTDSRSGASYYVIEITPDAVALDVLAGAALVAGMPVEVHLRTQDRTPLSYLLKPLDDQLRRSFRAG
ncbi:HlyD family type I secretion periplasmic adaptor subunit [Xanthobacter flavus]|uniref:HlyD family type I secretion periplasmic adaptor subunit n=1 Tax=Xanthobacter flavus TaxID=281 RepID=UPI00372A8293